MHPSQLALLDALGKLTGSLSKPRPPKTPSSKPRVESTVVMQLPQQSAEEPTLCEGLDAPRERKRKEGAERRGMARFMRLVATIFILWPHLHERRKELKEFVYFILKG